MSIASTARGLTRAEAEASRRDHGSNVLTPPPRNPWWQLYLEKFDDPVIRILMIAAGIAIAVGAVDGHIAEGVGILLAILLATFLAFWNEFRAAKEFDVLNQTSDDVSVKAIRDGEFALIPRRDVVVGDVIQVEVGEEIPADGTLVEAVSLQVDEGKLTGESRPVDKSIAAEGTTSETAYSLGRLLRGTTVVDGYGLYQVTAVGDRTEFGSTLREAVEESEGESPLNRQLTKLSQMIGVVGFGVAVLTFFALIGRGVVTGRIELAAHEWLVAGSMLLAAAIGMSRVWLPMVADGFELAGREALADRLRERAVRPWWQALLAASTVIVALLGLGIGLGYVPATPSEWISAQASRQILRDFMIAVTIVVVAVPEGLAMSVTLSLAYSMRKMTATNNLVRRMEACETIGAATVICTDKTGTLTRNEMRVAEAVIAGQPGMPHDARLRDLLGAAVAINSSAQLGRSSEGDLLVIGNPTEGAMLLWLRDHEIDYAALRERAVITTQWTFSTERKWMATLTDQHLHLKGAPEVLLARCQRTERDDAPLDDGQRASILDEIRKYQARGMRVLGLAYRATPVGGFAESDLDQIAYDLIWLGFVAISDPVRDEVPSAIAACRAAGVDVKIVTGDNSETAIEIGRRVGLWNDTDVAGRHRSGAEFAGLGDAEASPAAARLQVLSRARPADKLRLVRLLKKQGEVVAVTGDGVNDGPALNHADVGLAMGKTGTSVAKEASDIILLDDSFQSIVTAIRWGRALYENIQRFVLFQLTINVTALALAVLGPFIGFELPLTVMQMLWVNLIMDTFAALALATEPPHDAVMRRPPRSPNAFIVSKEMARSIFGTAAFFLVVLIGLILFLRSQGELATDAPSRGGTILFTVFVFLQFWNLFNARCLGRNSSTLSLLNSNAAFTAIAVGILVGQVLLVQFGGVVFRTVPLSLEDWVAVVGGTSVVLIAGEVIRGVRRLFESR